MSLWEENKARRRAQILAAARELIGEGGMSALTMRKLGERAKVSVRTIYNLMGSQSDILRAVIAKPMSEMLEAVSAVPQNAPIEKLDAIVSVSIGQFVRQPKVLRAAVAASYHLPGYNWHDWVKSQAIPLFRECIEDAIKDDLLTDQLSPEILAENIFHATNKAFTDWTQGNSSDAHLRVQAMSALYLPLLGVATEKSQARILERLKSLDNLRATQARAA